MYQGCNSLTFSMLSATYIATSHRRHISQYLVLSPYVIGNICRRSFISLNFAGLLLVEARISTQLLMMSHGENEAVNAGAFNLFTGHFDEFE